MTDFSETRSALKKLAMKEGADTLTGHVAHNLLEQTEIAPTYTRPDWVSHESQTLPWMIKRQMKLLGTSQLRRGDRS